MYILVCSQKLHTSLRAWCACGVVHAIAAYIFVRYRITNNKNNDWSSPKQLPAVGFWRFVGVKVTSDPPVIPQAVIPHSDPPVPRWPCSPSKLPVIPQWFPQLFLFLWPGLGWAGGWGLGQAGSCAGRGWAGLGCGLGWLAGCLAGWLAGWLAGYFFGSVPVLFPFWFQTLLKRPGPYIHMFACIYGGIYGRCRHICLHMCKHIC